MSVRRTLFIQEWRGPQWCFGLAWSTRYMVMTPSGGWGWGESGRWSRSWVPWLISFCIANWNQLSRQTGCLGLPLSFLLMGQKKKKTFCEKTMFISMEYNRRGRGNILESRFQLRRGRDQPAHLCPSVKYFRDTRHWAALFTAHYQQQPEEIRENLSGRGVLFTTSH